MESVQFFGPSVIFIVKVEVGQLSGDGISEIGTAILSETSAGGGPSFDIGFGQAQIVDITAIGQKQPSTKNLKR